MDLKRAGSFSDPYKVENSRLDADTVEEGLAALAARDATGAGDRDRRARRVRADAAVARSRRRSAR